MNRNRASAAVFAVLAIAAITLTAWTSLAGATSKATITGAGSTFVQPLVAAWTPADIRQIDDEFDFEGRIERDDWIGQAKALLHGGRIDLDAVSARGYAFQIETTYRALRAGFRVVEVPITFADRRVGTSKMSPAIATEAIWRVPYLRALALAGRLR